MPIHEKVLIVEDEENALTGLAELVSGWGYRTDTARDGLEGLERAQAWQPGIVLNDLKMPRMDGLQLMKRVRKHDPAIPMLLISGALLEEDQIKTAEEEADGYLRKPFSVDELHGFIEMGMQLREKYKRLAELLPDRKVIRDLLRGKAKIEKVIEDAEHLKEANEILGDLKKAG